MNPMFSEISFSKAIDKLSSLNECKTPLQMAYLVQDMVEEDIIETLEAFLKAQGILKENNVDAITTDDLIPVISYVISQSDYIYYHSTLFFMENFIFSDITPTKLAFILINFRAAMTFICEETKEVTMDLSPHNSTRGVSRIVPTLTTSPSTTITHTPPDSPTHTYVLKISSEHPTHDFPINTTPMGTKTTSSNGNLHSNQDNMRNFSNASKVTPGGLQSKNSLKLSSSQVTTSTVSPTNPERNVQSFQRAPEVILVNQNQQNEVLNYLKSLQKQ